MASNCNDMLCSVMELGPVMLIRGELRAVIRRLWLQLPG